LAVDEVFSSPTVDRDVRQGASLQEALAQPGVCDWLGDSLTAKSLATEHGDSRFLIYPHRHKF